MYHDIFLTFKCVYVLRISLCYDKISQVYDTCVRNTVRETYAIFVHGAMLD